MENLKLLRKQKSLSQQEVATALNIQRGTYNSYENDFAEPKIEMLKKLADYYGCSVDYLVGHETPGIFDLGYLTDDQKTAVKMLTKLNQANFIQAYSFIAGLYVEQ